MQNQAPGSSLKLIRVFLASPSDLASERKAAVEAIREINRTVARPKGYQIDLVGWEDTLSSVGRPQEIINAELDTCDAFIGMLWERWGTPPDLDGKYTSGFEEEYTRSRDRHRSSGKPYMRLFFKDINEAKLSDPGPEVKRVLRFRDKVIAEKAVFFQVFTDSHEFARHVRVGMADYLDQIVDSADRLKATGGTSASPPVDEAFADQIGMAGNNRSELNFLKGLAVKADAGTGLDLEPLDIARIRNITCAAADSRNDVLSVGAHDANLLYKEKANISLGSQEVSALADAGLDALNDENVPLWTWLAKSEARVKGWLAYSTVIASASRREAAFNVMRLLRYNLDDEDGLVADKEELYGMWFDEEVRHERAAALNYLAEVGDISAIKYIDAEIGKADGNSAIAANAKLAIVAREQPEVAALFVMTAASISDSNKYLPIALSAIPYLPKDVLRNVSAGATPRVMLEALHALEAVDGIDAAVIDRALAHASARVRRWAVDYKSKIGEPLSEADVHSVLVKNASAPSLLLNKTADTDGQAAHDLMKHENLMRREEADLTTLISARPLSADDVFFALCRKSIRKRIGLLRSNFDNRFKEFWHRHKERALQSYTNEDTRATIGDLLDSLEQHRKRGWMRMAATILCEYGRVEDLGRLRLALDEAAVEPRLIDIIYLGKHGGHEDINRAVKIYNDYRSSFLTETFNLPRPTKRQIAKAVMRMTGDNILNALAGDIPSNFLAMMISVSSSVNFKQVGEAQIIRLLHDHAPLVRKTAALKAILSRSAISNKQLLDSYLSNSKENFYNVVFWLDLNVAYSQSQAREIALQELNKTIDE